MPVMCVGESATPERRKQLGGLMTEVVTDEGRSFRRQKARNVGVIDDLFENDVLSDPQYMAALKIQEIHSRATDGKSCKVLCSPFLIDPGQHDSEWKIIARMDSLRLLHEAFAKLTQTQRDIVEGICVYDHSAANKDDIRAIRRGHHPCLVLPQGQSRNAV
jgi:hypothetical protein